jgi:hypothetical protein
LRECQNIQPNVQNADHVTKLKKDKVKDKSFYNVAKSKLTQQLLGKSIYIWLLFPKAYMIDSDQCSDSWRHYLKSSYGHLY